MTAEERIEALRGIELVAGLPEERLRWLAEVSDDRVYEPNEMLWREGEEPLAFFFLLDGRVETSIPLEDGSEQTIVDHHPPTYLGAIPLLSSIPYPGASRAVERSTVIATPAEAFFSLVQSEVEVRRELMSRFRPVFTRFEQVRGQREKMAALGSLSAGLAHELNNPASAAGRAPGELADALVQLQEGVGHFAERGVSAAALQQLTATATDARRRAAEAPPLDALDRSDREEALADALAAAGVNEAWDVAPDLVDAGIDVGCAAAVAESVGADVAAEALEWVAAGARAEALARQLAEATGRISKLVKAVKEYSYMDEAPEQDVDLHRGIETTLTVLAHKLKKGDVRVVRELDERLPRIHAYGSELNQVWTNLLDNAIDAVAGDGTITVRSSCDGDSHVIVEVLDDGPGIPEESLSRIFDPFFTTKDVGEGTGLGLDVAWRIVVTRHRGDLRVESEPGRTRFVVRLPVNAPVPAPA